MPVDYVSRAIVQIVLHAEDATGTTFHVAAGRHRSWTVGEVVDHAVEYFNRTNERSPLPSVRFIPPFAYRSLLPKAASAGGHLQNMIALYEPYLSIERVFDTTNTARVLRHTGIAPSHPSEYFERLIDYCLSSNWGRGAFQAAC